MVVTPAGIGSLRAGMSITDAGAALGASLDRPTGGDSLSCSYVTWPGAPEGVALMIEGGKVVRVDVTAPAVATLEGAKVGDAEARIDALYAGRLTKGPHKYTAGKYLTVAPATAADSGMRVIFEVDSGVVTRYRSGQMPHVAYVEGCS
jgi:hypothetical protein